MRPCILLMAGLAACSYGARVDDPVDLTGWRPGPAREKAKRTGSSNAGEGARSEPKQTLEQTYQLDLETVLKLAGSNAVEIELARSRAREAHHRADQEAARVLPAVRPSLAFQKVDGSVQATAGQFLDVDKQNTYLGGAVELAVQPAEALFRMQAARRRERAATASLGATTNTTLLHAAERYFGLVATHAAIQIAKDAVTAARELLKVEQSRREAGAGLQASVSRARARLAETEGALASARADAAFASSRLAEILTLDAGMMLVPQGKDAAAPIQLVDADQDFEVLLTRAVKNRPELMAATAEFEARGSERSLTGSGWLIPELRLGASSGGYGRNPGNLDDQEIYWAALQWKLDFGILSRHSAAREREHQARVALEGMRNSVAASVATSRRRIIAARARISAARTEVEAASQTLELVKSRQGEGEDLLLRVLDAQSTLSRARTALVVAVADHNAAQYAMLRALGGPE